MLVSMVIVILYWIRKASSSRVYIVAALAGIAMGAFAVILIMQGSAYMAFRSYFTYLTLIMGPLATCIMMEMHGGLNEVLAKICIWIWFFC